MSAHSHAPLVALSCVPPRRTAQDRHESVDLFHGVERGSEKNYIDREEKEALRHRLQAMAGLDPFSVDSEQRLVAILERFHIVPTTQLRQALMDWKIKGWQDLVQWKGMP